MRLNGHDNKQQIDFTINEAQNGIPWRLHLFVGIAGLVIITTMVYGFYLGNHMIEKYAPLIDASMEIKFEATTAHLWFEEIMSGDRFEDINEVNEHLNLSLWYATAMLEGGKNQEGHFLPLEDPVLRAEIEAVSEKINHFKKITQQRYEAMQESGSGSVIDQRYDKIFKALINQADSVESKLQAEIAVRSQLLKIIQLALIIISLFSICLILWLFHRFESRRTFYIQSINEANKNLGQALEEIKTLQGIIPICSYCNKIRNEKGLWNKLESYIQEHSEAQFSHSACPDCFKKQMAELENDT